MKSPTVDVAIVGAGAAGLMTAIWAGRSAPGQQIVLLDGARKLGAKILVAGGGRCNVSHHHVDESAFAGSSRNAIRKVLRRFDVSETRAFFLEQGVALKQEETGKLFPTTDSSRTILSALIKAGRDAGVDIRNPCRIDSVAKLGSGFRLSGSWGALDARTVVLATGGQSIPKSGSDGHGYRIAQALGHTISGPLSPALVPLTLPKDHFLCELSGVTLPATLDLWSGTGKRLQTFTGSMLLTHFGLSGPTVLDMSRYYLLEKIADPDVTLTVNWSVDSTPAEFEEALLTLGSVPPLTLLRQKLPDRLARALVALADTPGAQLTRVQRKQLVDLVTRYPLPITGNRGYNYAEVTAGGVPLSEINLKTMESRVCPNLFLVGELCDVDGRIGGFNFQWAWSSGHVAGVGVGRGD